MSNLGPRLARTPLHLFWVLDTSGSMGVDGKIDALNDAIEGAVSALRDAVEENPGVELLVRVVAFDHDARWHIEEPTDIEDLVWRRLDATPKGTTELGRGLQLVTDEIGALRQGGRGLPPAIILVSDGKPTDLKSPSFGASLRAMSDEPWAAKSSRMAIGIGADADMGALQRFIGHDEIEPLRAGNAGELAHYLRWASTVVVDELSKSGTSFSAEAEHAAEESVTTEPPSPSGDPVDLPPPPSGDPVDLPPPPSGEPVDLPPPPSGEPVDLPAPPPPPSPPPPPALTVPEDDIVTW